VGAPGFDTFLVVDWSAAKGRKTRPTSDAIWLGIVRDGIAQEPEFCATRIAAEARIVALIASEQAAGRRLLAGFDFPFGYPQGFARHVTGTDDPFAVWDWIGARITDTEKGENNRFDVAEDLNALFDGDGPFWAKPNKVDWPGIPFRKAAVRFAPMAERRACDLEAKASSSCFQLFNPPTVGGQMLMGLPMLNRLRQIPGVAVWPFEAWQEAPAVLAEIWPGVIEPAVKAALATAGPDAIRDRAQVGLLALALSRLSASELYGLMSDLPDAAGEEGWILGAGLNNTLVSRLHDSAAPAPLKNDCFALPPGVHWTPVDAALDDLRARLTAVVGTETVAFDTALGRVLAADISAPRANPPLPNTAVDGYGFAGGCGAGTHRLALIGAQAAAGMRLTDAVPAGAAVRILTGAALPEGVDTVVLQEDVALAQNAVTFTGPIRRGANTRAAGEDVAAGDAVARQGRRLTPADLAVLAAVGVATVQAYVPLRVGVLSTGDELVAAGQAAAPGQIFDANRPMLMGLIRQLGHVPVDLGQVADDSTALRVRLDRAATQADVILTSGGASAGDADHVSAVLNAAGAMALWRIAIKPGRPLALGMWAGKPVFGLPGNPVAAMVCTLVFGAPALAQMAGAAWSEPQGFNLPAAFEKRKKPGRREYLRARVRHGRVEVFASEGSGRISGLAWAEGLVELPDGALHVQPGDMVRYIPWGGFGLWCQ
jgi:molybdopterin molybdotransferase